MSAVEMAKGRRDDEIRALMHRRELCERARGEWRPIPNYDPGGALAKGERMRREDLEREIDRCEADAKKLSKMKDAELVAKFVPEVEAQRQLDELHAEGFSLVDTLARGARR